MTETPSSTRRRSVAGSADPRKTFTGAEPAAVDAQLGGFFHLDVAARRRAMAANGARNQLGRCSWARCVSWAPSYWTPKFRHQHLAGLGHHIRLGETAARVTAEAAPATRWRPR
ncbi:hypothetical protein ABZU75_37825 [Streptosporangium sp. NPDC005286]|uniref:hypothetical protein n=1 Tax=Streptosporangium sp. NPDC005286 TaxID=3154463 RepID=UPI0033A7C4E9